MTTLKPEDKVILVHGPQTFFSDTAVPAHITIYRGQRGRVLECDRHRARVEFRVGDDWVDCVVPVERLQRETFSISGRVQKKFSLKRFLSG